MILANIARAVREQNYYAVAIEFLIVILGVVIGFQISAWAADGDRRAREAAALERLRAEVDDLLAIRQRALSSAEEALEELSRINAIIGPDSEAEGGAQLCERIDRSHIFLWEAARIPALEELRASGELGLIRDDAIRAALVDFDLRTTSERDRVQIIRSVENILRLQFPDIVQIGPAPRGAVAEEGWRVECDWAAMRGSQAFISAVTNNYDRQAALNNLRRREMAALQALSEALGER